MKHLHNTAYDPIGQLKVADSSVDGEDRGYAYDAAWNLNSRLVTPPRRTPRTHSHAKNYWPQIMNAEDALGFS